MANIKVLDCTLRDGGYCNQWQFGYENIRKITGSLADAGVDIIECGFLTNRVDYDPDVSKFTAVEQFSPIIPADRKGKMFVCMANYGEYRAEDLPVYDGTSVDAIRVAFHKSDAAGALELCKGIRDKGYKVFVQPMVSLNYTDEEFLQMIRSCNEIDPYAFYIVDSFGMMKRKDLTRLYYIVEHNLKPNICIGFHSHNNMQLAYSNAQFLVDNRTVRDMVIDSSVFGMGRGAGNLNTELFVEFLNDTVGTSYELKPILAIIDQILNPFYQRNYWGYSLPNYLSAAHNAHPNYAGYLDDKKTLTIESMDEIFSMMDENKKFNFDRDYIEYLYLQYMAIDQTQESHLLELKKMLAGKNVLLIAPGKSVSDEQDKVLACAGQDDVVTISVNFDYPALETDLIFLSNLRRFRELDPAKRGKCIVTSNIPAVGTYLQTNYRNLLNDVDAVRDNAGMMLIRFLINLGVQKVYIAGIDGYSIDLTQNFAEERMSFYAKRAALEAMNAGMTTVLQNYSKEIRIEFVTTPKYVRV